MHNGLYKKKNKKERGKNAQSTSNIEIPPVKPMVFRIEKDTCYQEPGEYKEQEDP